MLFVCLSQCFHSSKNPWHFSAIDLGIVDGSVDGILAQLGPLAITVVGTD